MSENIPLPGSPDAPTQPGLSAFDRLLPLLPGLSVLVVQGFMEVIEELRDGLMDPDEALKFLKEFRSIREEEALDRAWEAGDVERADEEG